MDGTADGTDPLKLPVGMETAATDMGTGVKNVRFLDIETDDYHLPERYQRLERNLQR
ncbi:hypothetical protein [Mycolicibacterium mageritense]|uniref:hypothetical protein n=1 Tax=Mycolicibacterium mageritense TaxID=53462 RepID=UPI001E2C34AB|nr:hypothetical protein [Mycolicibacterium mageritense]GJJ17824.1 hypothetical protein MTY414_14970 [Mycolicibacterium mageritense]